VKRKAEQWGFDYTVLRLCTVYGPGFRPGGMFDYLAGAVPREKLSARIAWPGRMSIVEVNDAADILIHVSVNSQAANRTFLVSSDEDPTMSQMVECAAQWMKAATA
jgi:nucleoside-diphosphate-sugar epimerase